MSAMGRKQTLRAQVASSPHSSKRAHDVLCRRSVFERARLAPPAGGTGGAGGSAVRLIQLRGAEARLCREEASKIGDQPRMNPPRFSHSWAVRQVVRTIRESTPVPRTQTVESPACMSTRALDRPPVVAAALAAVAATLLFRSLAPAGAAKPATNRTADVAAASTLWLLEIVI
jgi:hypothetical protein